MERLTVRSFDGSAHAKCVAYYDIIDKLAEYEDLEEQIMKKFAGCIDIKTILDSFCAFYDMQETKEELAQCTLLTNEDVLKYRQWKDAEEQGLLLRLPCKVGDMVYHIEDGYIYEFEAKSIDIRKEDDEYIYCIDSMDYRKEHFGKIAFLTLEEAEQALARMEGENE